MSLTYLWGSRNIPRWLALLVAIMGGMGVFPLAGEGQTARRGALDVRVMVGEITDKRTTGQFFSECEVQLKVIGDAVAESLGVRTVRVRSAVDDTGRDLLRADEDKPSSDSVGDEPKGSVEKKVTLKNPARSAKFIRLLEGEVELFQPTAANGGVVVDKKFMARPNQPLLLPALKKWNVQVTYFTKEGLEAKKKQLEQQQEAGTKDTGEKFGKALAEAFGSIFSGMMDDSEDSLRFVIEDPDGRVAGLRFRDAKGKAIDVHSRSSSRAFHSYSLEGGVPPADTQLYVYLATPESLKVVPFKLENIPLP